MVLDQEQFEADMNAAIQEVVRKHEQGFVFKWVAIVDTDTEQDGRGLWTFTSPDMSAWDSMGMLRYADAMEKAKVDRWMVESEEEDDDSDADD